MDNLSADVRSAICSGMSYGKWKALNPKTKHEEPDRKQKEKQTKICPECGREFTSHLPSKIYCSEDCGKPARNRRAIKKYREKNRGEENGNQD